MKLPSDQFLWVCQQLVAKPALSNDAKTLFLALLLRLYEDLPPLPVPRLPLGDNNALKTRFSALNELVKSKMCAKVKKADGWHGVIMRHHPIMAQRKQVSSLADYSPAKENTITTAQLIQAWNTTYQELFNKPSPRDSKDLVRFRFVLRRLGGVRSLHAIQDFLHTRRAAPQKATTLSFYCQHGRDKKTK